MTTTSSLGLRPKGSKLATFTNNSGVPPLGFKSGSATSSCVCDLEKITHIFCIFKMQLIINWSLLLQNCCGLSVRKCMQKGLAGSESEMNVSNYSYL